MRLIDVMNSPWAIPSEKLLEIRAIYEAHLRGPKIDLAAVEARLGRPLANEPRPYQVERGVAIVPVVGVLAKRANMLMQVSGGTSTQIIGDMLEAAAEDPSVAAIVLEIDSPGGSVDGVQLLADQVARINQTKPVHAWATGTCCSGAYWIAAAAERVLIADRTTAVGSIGVVATHVDVSQAQAKAGVATTEVTAGRYKRIASSYSPLSSEGRAEIQAQVDAIYQVFVDAVAAGRDVPVDQVLSDMADGRVFIGQAAIDVGLVDGVSTLDELIAQLAQRPGAGRASPAASPTRMKGAQMNLEQLNAEHPALVESIRKEGFDAGLAQGVTQERERHAALDAAAVPGHADLLASAKAQGLSADQYAGLVLKAERDERAQAAQDLAADKPQAVPAADPAAEPAPAPYKAPSGFGVSPRAAADHQKALAYAAEHNVDYVTAVKAVRANP